MSAPGSFSSRIAVWAALCLVIASFFWFASAGGKSFANPSTGSLYARLAEGFLQGQLGLAETADPRLAALPDPYRIETREGIPYLWDASYFEGRYFLYFTPLPALLFYIPWRLIRGVFPPDALAAACFASVWFLFTVAFLRRALGAARLRLGAVLLMGLGTLVPFLLVVVYVYEVAVTFAMMATAAWAWSLVRFLQRPRWSSALLLGGCLAMASAARPNLALLGVITAVALFSARERRSFAILVACAIPVIAVGGGYALYNDARFGSPTELGMTYQLTTVPMRDYTPCSLCTFPETARFFNNLMHHGFLPPKFDRRFPFVRLRYHDLDKSVSFVARSEQVGGVLPVVPLAGAGAIAALLLVSARRRTPLERNLGPASVRMGTLAGILVLGAGLLVMASLSTCSWVTIRYQLDYLGLLVAGSIVVIESGLARFENGGADVRGIRVLISILVVWSIAVGVLLGLTGRNDAFAERNPELFRRLESKLDAGPQG